MLIDIISMIVALFLAFWLRFETFTNHTHFKLGINLLLFSIPISLITLWNFGLYNRVILFTSLPDLIEIVKAVTIITGFKMGFIYFQWLGFSRAVIIADWLLNVVLISISRVLPRIIILALNNTFVREIIGYSFFANSKRVLIYGAGTAGENLVRELQKQPDLGYIPIGFIDDDINKKDTFVQGIKVYGSRNELPEIITKLKVDEIIIAISNASSELIRIIAKDCRKLGLHVKIVPPLQDLLSGRQARLQIRNIDINDLLKRPQVELNLDSITNYIKGKIILVTGAGGSIGSELCRQIIKFSPNTLLLLGQGENSIFNIHQELSETVGSKNIYLLPVIANIQDLTRLENIFKQYRPHIVFHAAAHKHVPLMEMHPQEAIKNNIFGTYNLLLCSRIEPPEKFVLVSTDKAVKPTSVMGATKRLAEILTVSESSYNSKTVFSVVRFGNVLGSRGSVLPIFMNQIEKGESIKITHPEMVRYFMTITEAAQLVLQAAAFANRGEIFVLDMGEPVKILELALDLIRLAGLEPYKDVKIEFTNPRPGEKFYEELVYESEKISKTAHDKIFITKSMFINHSILNAIIEKLKQICIINDNNSVKSTLFSILDEINSVHENFQN